MVVAAVSEDEEADFEWGGEGVLASILPVRAEIMAGDERALCLLWLLGVQTGEIGGDVVEPSVPAGLDALTGSQTAVVEFLRIDGDLVAIAAVGSTPRRSRPAEARRERLAALAAQGESAWARVSTRIAEKNPAGHDAAVELLVDLQEVTGKAEFARRVEALRDEHRRKPGLIGRLADAGL